MSMLSEKKQEILAKIDGLLAVRNARIDEQVKLYRESLEAEPEPAEVLELRKVIEAIDAVIAYETVEPAKEEIPVEEPKTEETIVEAVVEEPIVEAEPVQEQPAEEPVIEELPTQEELHLEDTPAPEEPIQVEIKLDDPIPVAETIPAGEVIHAQPERPGLAEIQIPERR